MNAADLAELEQYLTEDELVEFNALLVEDMADAPWRPLPGPQTMAYESEADIIGFGGAAGGGKTDLICGLVTTAHQRSLVARREKAQTEGVIQRLTELLGGTQGYNSQKSSWRLEGRILELAGLDNLGDERRWQGRPHDLKAFDEVTEQRESQVRFVMGWCRTNDPGQRTRILMTFNPPTTTEGRWVIAFFGPWLDDAHPLYPTPPGALRWCAMLPDANGGSADRWVDGPEPFVIIDGEPCYEFEPADYTPEQIIKPKSRTFIPSRLTDNPYYMASGYMATLQSLPEPLRSQMLNGDFKAGIQDDAFQVCPTAWVEAAMARWRPRSPRGEMLAMGVDVARGGKDNTIIATRHKADETDHWYDELKPGINVHPGSETPSGDITAALTLAVQRDEAPIFIDVIGVGASPYDRLVGAKAQVYGVNVAEKATAMDKSGRLGFRNLRTQLWWQFRELLDPENDTGIALPPDPKLKRELCAPLWSASGSVIEVESRDEIVKRIGVSPDRATAVILAQCDVIKRRTLEAMNRDNDPMNYNPYAIRR